MRVRAEWSPDTRDLFTAALGRPHRRRYLLVERLPDGGWDWAAWSGLGARHSRSGVAATISLAMEAAEYAADALTRVPAAGS